MVGEGNDLLAERVARLEAEVQLLRGEVSTLRGVATPVMPQGAAPLIPMARSQPLWVPQRVDAARVRLQEPTVAAAAKPAGSLEDKIGAKVLSKVAVVLLLIGVALFLKWAFDNKWIGAGGRVVAGLVIGSAVVVWSERFRKQQVAAFSYALKAVGSGVLYLSLWASFQLYHLVPGWVAFAAMVGVTAWNAVMALTQDSELLAGYALLGAYLTPVLLGSGGNHETFLFSYLFVIAAGLLVLLRRRPWSLLTAGALPVTAVSFFLWFVEYFRQSSTGVTIMFALLLWGVFAAMPVVAVEAEGVISGVLLPLGAGAFGASAMYAVLAESGNKAWEPWCAVGFAAVYLGLARVPGKALLGAMHLSLGVVFLTVAIPLKATGRGILLGWLVEAVALLAVSTVDGIDAKAKGVLRGLGCAALLLGVLGALVQPELFGAEAQAFWNRGFAMRIGAVLALAAVMVISRRMRDTAGQKEGVAIAGSAFVLVNLMLLVAMYTEIARSFEGDGHALGDFVFSAWMTLQGVANLTGGFWKRVAMARWIGLVLLGVTAVKAFAWDMRGLSEGYRVMSYLALGVLLMAVSFAYQRDWLGLRVLTSAGDDEVKS
jgi:uncharacterized membrane protein